MQCKRRRGYVSVQAAQVPASCPFQASYGGSTPTKTARFAENTGLFLTRLHITEGLAFAFRLRCIFFLMTVCRLAFVGCPPESLDCS